MVDTPFERQRSQWQQLVISGHGPNPDQYRVLTYLLAEALIRAGVPFTFAHALLRFLFTTASLAVFHRYLMLWVRPPFALLGLLMAAAVLPLALPFSFMQPSDPLNMLVFFLTFLALREKRDGWLIPLVVVGALNRETALLLPVLYALVRHGRTPRSEWLPRAAIAAAMAASIYVGLRMVYGFKSPYAETSPVQYWLANWNDSSAWIQLLCFFNLALWVGWREWGGGPEFLRRAAWLLPIFFLIHFSVGYLREIRYFLPILPISIPLALIVLRRRSEAPSPPRR